VQQLTRHNAGAVVALWSGLLLSIRSPSLATSIQSGPGDPGARSGGAEARSNTYHIEYRLDRTPDDIVALHLYQYPTGDKYALLQKRMQPRPCLANKHCDEVIIQEIVEHADDDSRRRLLIQVLITRRDDLGHYRPLRPMPCSMRTGNTESQKTRCRDASFGQIWNLIDTHDGAFHPAPQEKP